MSLDVESEAMARRDGPELTRFRLGMILGVSSCAVLACLSTWMIHAYRQAPYLAALKEERAWVVQPVGEFHWRLDPAGNTMATSGHRFLDEPTASPCLLKMAWLTGLDEKQRARFTVKKAISAEGYCESHNCGPFSVSHGVTDLDATQFARLGAILKRMPAEPKAVEPRDALLVGYVDPRGRWTTACYDFCDVPREIREIGGLLLMEFPDRRHRTETHRP